MRVATEAPGVTGKTITDGHIRELRRRRPDLLDLLMIAIHSLDSELRAMARAQFAALWNASDTPTVGYRMSTQTATKRGSTPLIHNAESAGLARCGNCEAGFRRVGGVHVGSQRLGMIPDTPCQRVFATHGGNMTEENARPWMAQVDGEPLRRASGDARRFGSADAAYRAACAAAPRRWHP